MQARSTNGKIICPRCKHVFSAARALNGDNDKRFISCGVCTAVIEIWSIVEYEYGLSEEQEDE